MIWEMLSLGVRGRQNYPNRQRTIQRSRRMAALRATEAKREINFK